MENQQPLQPIPPTQNKLWPINWKMNKAIKVFNLLSISAFVFHILSVIALIILRYSQECPPGMGCVAMPQISMFDYIIAILLYTAFLAFVILSLACIFISLLNFKRLDKFDKSLFWINIVALVGSVTIYGFFVFEKFSYFIKALFFWLK